MGKVLNRAFQTVASAPGQGNATLGPAVPGWQTAAQGGALDGDVLSCTWQDGAAWELSQAPYAASGAILGPRTYVRSSTGALLNLTAGATVYFAPQAADLLCPFRQRVINGNFAINQRGVSGSVTLAAGAYGHDRWKAGSGGCTYAFSTAASGDVMLTISAGTLVQVIEGALYLPEGGAYVLSWSGTATARVYQGAASGAYAASPVVAAGLTAGTNATVEVSTGTIGLAQFEPGAVATTFERRDDELRRCQRYYEAGNFSFIGNAIGGGAYVGANVFFKVVKYTAPQVTFNFTSLNNTQAQNIDNFSISGFRVYVQANQSANNVGGSGTYAASSEL